MARLASLLMKVGALGFALELNKTFSINLQLLGGIWILQTFPAIVIGLYTRWFHRIALITGWAAGMAYGTLQAYRTPGGGQPHFGASVAPVLGHTTYIAVTALIINLAVAAALTLAFRKTGLQDGYDETRPADYLADPVTVPTAAPGPSKTEPPPASWSPPEGSARLVEFGRTAGRIQRLVRAAVLPAGPACPTRRARITSRVRGHGPAGITIRACPSDRA